MFTKKERILTWEIMSVGSLLLGCFIQILAEIAFPGSWFYKVASFVFACSAVLGIGGIFLSFASIAMNDWQENKNTETFVNLGVRNDRILSVHKVQDAIIHLPVTGTAYQKIIVPGNAQIPYVAEKTLEHIHFGSQIPKVEEMDDELYQKLFGRLNK